MGFFLEMPTVKLSLEPQNKNESRLSIIFSLGSYVGLYGLPCFWINDTSMLCVADERELQARIFNIMSEHINML